MKRKIKFRIWDSENIDSPKMQYCDLLKVCDNGLFFEISKFDGYKHHNDTDNPTIMQFTGIEDAYINGTEVYEGDIIENCDTKALQIVYWNEYKAAWYCRYVEDEKRIVSLSDSIGNLNKVIGNIFENNELVKL